MLVKSPADSKLNMCSSTVNPIILDTEIFYDIFGSIFNFIIIFFCDFFLFYEQIIGALSCSFFFFGTHATWFGLCFCPFIPHDMIEAVI